MSNAEHQLTEDQLCDLYDKISAIGLLDEVSCVETNVACPLCGHVVIVIRDRAGWSFICRKYGELATARGM